MEIYNTVAALQQHLYQHSRFGKKIGFVPTMGALHEGHLTLILDALEENDIVVCSIFVNPTQFNDPNDLKKYPRPIEKDVQMLESVGCQILFLPEVEEIYPPTLVEPEFDLNGLDLPMEGAKRPGHFKGVVRVVGQKDFQQYAIIAQMLRQMNSGIRLLRVPIVRETDGLAMSSRNVRLSKEGRKLAPVLYKVLQEVEYYVNSQPFPIPKKAIELAMDLFQQHGIENIDYFEIVDAETLQELHSFEDSNFAVVCAVIVIDGVRLLDNVILFEK
jgi:pantoate--beta-alanine ligase